MPAMITSCRRFDPGLHSVCSSSVGRAEIMANPLSRSLFRQSVTGLSYSFGECRCNYKPVTPVVAGSNPAGFVP